MNSGYKIAINSQIIDFSNAERTSVEPQNLGTLPTIVFEDEDGNVYRKKAKSKTNKNANKNNLTRNSVYSNRSSKSQSRLIRNSSRSS